MEEKRAVKSSADTALQQAMASLQAGKIDDAVRLFKKLLAEQPRHVAGLNLISVVLTKLERYQEAEHYVRRALQENATSDATFYNYGVILKALGRPAEALQQFSHALKINAAIAETWNNRGTVFSDMKQYREANSDYDKAISLNFNYAECWYNKAKSLAMLGLHDQSLGAYTQALTLKPDFAEAWAGRGDVHAKLNQHFEAFADFDRAYAIKPDFPYLEGTRLHTKLFICDWSSLNVETSHLLSAIRNQALASLPFSIVAIPSSPALQLQCAKRCIADDPLFPKLWRGEMYSHSRIRVAYLSADFHDHATAYLMAGLFEQHDKSRFEVTAMSFGPDRDSDIGRRIRNSFEHFIDVRSQDDQEIAELIRRHEIDIAIDLKGFTQDARRKIFARRPAPIQVSYLGYPGTMGADYFDYIIADQTIIPTDQCEFYTEKVVWLPDSYQANDDQRRISTHAPTRQECALPEAGFVFSCFNNTYKITPEVFDIWIRLLKATENSVLWLIESNSTATANLRREAENRGVASTRLVFAPKINVADHLARHRQADLFLDTVPCNAHTTASDALWAGLPVLTCLGSTLAGRVAGSLLQAIGLPELVTSSLNDYEALALKLAQDSSFNASIKQKLVRHRDSYPLFNTKRFTRHIEAAYTKMWEHHQSGGILQGFSVDPLD